MSSSLHSAPRTDVQDELRRRFVEAARRAQIVTIVNRAQSEAELGDLVTAELCEAFEAELAFVLVRAADGGPHVVGAYGIPSLELSRFGDDAFVGLAGTTPRRDAGDDLLSLGARALVRVPFGEGPSRGVVGVARLYDQSFDEPETALLEAVAVSIEHALDRHRLGQERDRLYLEAIERSKAARVIGSIADGVVLVDGAGIVQLWNPAAEAITGLSGRAVVGRPLEEVVGGWPAAGGLADRRASPTARATTVPVDLGGREVWLSIRSVGFEEGTVYAFTDLTEDRRLEQLKADFIATVSHELRTPLAAVHGAAKTLQRENVVAGTEVFEHLLALIAEQSERLAGMVDDILLASRIDSPELGLATGRVDVGPLAAEVVAAARAHASEQLQLELLAPPSPPVLADRERLRQVLTNLVANAVKYSPAGGRIQVDLQVRDGHLDIAVRDQGLGIAIAEQRLIFEKFYRVDVNMSRGVSGSGLGLYICRELVHRMGGTIAVESRPGEGSTFIVTLPLAP